MSEKRKSPLTGKAYPRCSCGAIVYAEGMCYRCFQAATKNDSVPLESGRGGK